MDEISGFEHASVTDYTSRFIRYGIINRDEASELVRKGDHNLDPLSISDFINFVGYTATEFWGIVDKFYNRNLFEKNGFGEWVLKDPILNKKE